MRYVCRKLTADFLTLCTLCDVDNDDYCADYVLVAENGVGNEPVSPVSVSHCVFGVVAAEHLVHGLAEVVGAVKSEHIAVRLACTEKAQGGIVARQEFGVFVNYQKSLAHIVCNQRKFLTELSFVFNLLTDCSVLLYNLAQQGRKLLVGVALSGFSGSIAFIGFITLFDTLLDKKNDSASAAISM